MSRGLGMIGTSRPSVLIRELGAGDAPCIRSAFAQLSPKSRYRRFGRAFVEPEQALAWVRELDGHDRLALGACTAHSRLPVGVARYVRLDAETAEIAATVLDRWQHRGIGRALLDRLLLDARREGLHELRAAVVTNNPPAIRLLRRVGAERVGASGAGLKEYAIPLAGGDPEDTVQSIPMSAAALGGRL
jgi:GNAT superfamily N-acetyltransferase